MNTFTKGDRVQVRNVAPNCIAGVQRAVDTRCTVKYRIKWEADLYVVTLPSGAEAVASGSMMLKAEAK